MNWKLLFAGTTMTYVVLLGNGDCSASGIDALRPAVGHPELMLDSGLWRAAFLSEKGNMRASEVDDLLSAQTESQLSSGLVTTEGTASSFPVPAGDATLSDWQQAAAVSVGRKGRTLNSNGPSLISLVVGVVGLIVIVGAYMTSGKKQH